jgi:hypothetical protein
MLSSIATLIHDTYLPVYLQDVLGLSNTRVSGCSIPEVADTAGHCSGVSCCPCTAVWAHCRRQMMGVMAMAMVAASHHQQWGVLRCFCRSATCRRLRSS